MAFDRETPDVQLGRWKLIRLLASGGMGEVWEAHADGQRAAVKRMRSASEVERADSRRRFRDEGAIGLRLQHPNVGAFLEVGEHEGTAFLVMELLEGATLGDLSTAGGWPVGAVLGCAVQALEALHYAHVTAPGAPVVHRDIKPSNLFLTSEGTLKVIDFGIARAGDLDQTQTATGTLRGSLRYCSPEHVNGEPLTPASDLFSLGVVLHELLVGAPLYKRPTDAAILSAILWTEPPAVSNTRPDVPPAVVELVGRALKKAPGDRFSSAAQMLSAARAIEDADIWDEARLSRWLATRVRNSRQRPTEGTASLRAAHPLPGVVGSQPSQSAAPGERASDGSTAARSSRSETSQATAAFSSASPTSPRSHRMAMTAAATIVALLLLGSGGVLLLNRERGGKEPQPEHVTPPSMSAAGPVEIAAPAVIAGMPTHAAPAVIPGALAHAPSAPPAPGGAAVRSGTGARTGISAVDGPGSRTGAVDVGATDTDTDTDTGTRVVADGAIGDARVVARSRGTARETSRKKTTRPAATTQKARPRESQGFLTVATRSGYAEVFANGKSLGVTPLFRHPLPSGRYTLEAVKADGMRKQRRVTIAPNAETRWPVQF